MAIRVRVDRATFLTLTAASAVVTLVGCGDDDAEPVPAGGAAGTPGGASGAGGASGGSGGSSSGSGGTAKGGTTGAGTGGQAGAGSGSGGASGGTAGKAGGSGGNDGGAAGKGTGGAAGGSGKGGNAGTGAGGKGGAGGEDAGMGGGGTAGTGDGGTGGSGVTMCQQGALSATETSSGTHMHTLLITAMGINMGTMTYMTGPGGMNQHTHSLMLTPPEVQMLRGGGTVTKTTAMDATGHTHTYEIECMP